jgi:hypothetical protein
MKELIFDLFERLMLVYGAVLKRLLGRANEKAKLWAKVAAKNGVSQELLALGFPAARRALFRQIRLEKAYKNWREKWAEPRGRRRMMRECMDIYRRIEDRNPIENTPEIRAAHLGEMPGDEYKCATDVGMEGQVDKEIQRVRERVDA